MIKPACILLACAMSVNGTYDAHADESDAYTKDTHLRCNKVSFQLRTERTDGSVIAQRLTVTLPTGQSAVVALPVRLVHQTDLAGPKQALNRSITQWACRRTTVATFLEMLYKCNDYINDKNVERSCAKSGEWLGYIDLKGHFLDAGYRPDDPRYHLLARRLGLPAALDEEPRIEPVTPIN